MSQRASMKLNRTLLEHVQKHIAKQKYPPEDYQFGFYLGLVRLVRNMHPGERDITPLMSTAEMERYLRGMLLAFDMVEGNGH